MLKRFVTIAALAALPLASACNSGANAPEPAAAPDRAASPAGTDSRPPDHETGAAPAENGAAAQPNGVPAAEAAPGAAKEGNPRTASTLADKTPQFREVTIPAGTLIRVELQTGVSSASSEAEDAVRATVRSPVTIDGYEAVPAGSTLTGAVTDARRSGRVKGRAHVAFRFSSLQARDERIDIRTSTVARTAPATKKSDAAKIGIGAGAGAVIGGIAGGGSGAAKGAAIGGAGGTGVVLATRGKEVSIPSGANLAVKLLEPITVRVPARR
jgi:hypothetical protein